MQLRRFTVFYPYAKVIEHLARDDLPLAYELSYHVIMYGIYGVEPSDKSDEKLLEHFYRIKPTIEKFRNRSIKRLKHGVSLYDKGIEDEELN